MLFFQNKFKRKMKIYYICQFVQGFDKIVDVILLMKEDPDIDIRVLAFPNDISQYPKNPELSFWQEKFGDIVINAVVEDGWFDLKSAKPDYVFVQRPYNNYLPDEYSTDCIAEFSKLCYIPYAFNLVNIRDISLNQSFLKDCYFFFADNFDEYEYAKKIMVQYKNRYSMNLGYPSLDEKFRHLSFRSCAFDRIKGDIQLKVIWTPRWTTDPKLFQTTFFDYKDDFVKYFQKNRNMQLVFRPHPLAFKNFIDEGLMSQKEVDKYLTHFDAKNMIYDQEQDYFETFKLSDVLITDFSSIIIDYMLLGKPIILCDQNKSRYTSIMTKINEVCYSAKNWEEIEAILNHLKQGQDPMKKKRLALCKKLFAHIHDTSSSSMQIVECIKNDFLQKKI